MFIICVLFWFVSFAPGISCELRLDLCWSSWSCGSSDRKKIIQFYFLYYLHADPSPSFLQGMIKCWCHLLVFLKPRINWKRLVTIHKTLTNFPCSRTYIIILLPNVELQGVSHFIRLVLSSIFIFFFLSHSLCPALSILIFSSLLTWCIHTDWTLYVRATNHVLQQADQTTQLKAGALLFALI